MYWTLPPLLPLLSPHAATDGAHAQAEDDCVAKAAGALIAQVQQEATADVVQPQAGVAEAAGAAVAV